ncbi:MAG: hypothetical protein ABI836_07460 [Gemmatimonadota bacterium]
MKLYWVKIIFGALAIFALGMVIRTGINKGKDRIHSITETSDPINIPFPLGIMPFRLDGTRLGNVERVTLLRDSPKGISNIRVVVKLADSISPERLKRCMLVIEDPQRINENTTFRCQAADTAGLKLVPYGQVNIDGLETSFPLLLTAAAVADLRSDSANSRMEAGADSIANAAEAYADSMDQRADSLTTVNMERADSIREEANQRSDSLREATLRMADSIRQSRRAIPPRRPRR